MTTRTEHVRDADVRLEELRVIAVKSTSEITAEELRWCATFIDTENRDQAQANRDALTNYGEPTRTGISRTYRSARR
jgi:hypothetical protein